MRGDRNRIMTAIRTILLSKIKSRLETFLDDTCTIKRESNTFDSMGAQVGNLETVASGVSCRVINGKSDVENQADQETITEWYRLIVPVGTQLGADYLVELSSDGSLWRVLEVITRRTEKTDHQAIIKRAIR